MNGQTKQETDDAQAVLSKRYAALMSSVEKLSMAQIELFLHEIEWIIKQLEKVGCQYPPEKKPYEQVLYEPFGRVETMLFATKDILLFERAKRSILSLQGMIIDGGKCGCEMSLEAILLSSMNSSSDEQKEGNESPV